MPSGLRHGNCLRKTSGKCSMLVCLHVYLDVCHTMSKVLADTSLCLYVCLPFLLRSA